MLRANQIDACHLFHFRCKIFLSLVQTVFAETLPPAQVGGLIRYSPIIVLVTSLSLPVEFPLSDRR